MFGLAVVRLMARLSRRMGAGFHGSGGRVLLAGTGTCWSAGVRESFESRQGVGDAQLRAGVRAFLADGQPHFLGPAPEDVAVEFGDPGGGGVATCVARPEQDGHRLSAATASVIDEPDQREVKALSARVMSNLARAVHGVEERAGGP